MLIKVKQLYIYLTALLLSIPFIFDLNTANFLKNKIYYMVFLDDFVLAIILFLFLIIFFINKKIYRISKSDFIALIILFSFKIYFFINYKFININIVKIFFYLLFYSVVIQNLELIVQKIDFNKLVKIFLFITLGSLFLLSVIEIYLFFLEKPKYLIEIVEKYLLGNEAQFLSNKNGIEKQITTNEISNPFVANYRLSIFLSNPTSVILSLSLIYFLFSIVFVSFIYKYFVLFFILIIGLFTASKLYIIFIGILFLDLIININNKKNKTIIIISLISFLIILFIFFISKDNFEIKNLYFSRFIFYEQFISQIDVNYLFRYQFENIPTYINKDNKITGAHSDLIYLISNYGLIYFINIIYILRKDLKFNYFTLYLLIVSLFNGLILTLFVFLTLILINLNEINNSNTYKE